MTTNQITKRAALLLTATGPTLFVGLILHPHAPKADSMAEVAFTQTGQPNWWPAHVLLVSSYVVFALFLSTIRRLPALSPPARRVLKLAVPVAWFCVLAMLIHLLLPLGRESVANSQRGWALWVKDVVESVDGVWALCVVAVAWTLGRAGIVGNRLTALLGVAGGFGFALFSFLIPLTGVVVPMQFTRTLVDVVPVFGILMVAWAVVAGPLLGSRMHPE
ncbi:hypothetical protein PUN71_020875 [Arthrobacter sp. NQ7]|uniref:hypothetical protein n=1 Tax=Arthrobacter sp. NQ7 TaxID=3032303 RepID=UPI002410ADF2|nr:hypothetical protein [Arthrobacter sp. NQ7]MDJ0459668.1 hypothetical protein [Arthrobacter sp. NQ7]